MPGTQHSEVERKYTVEPHTSLPTFTDAPGVADVGPPEEIDQEAVYFDTGQLDLLAHGITVRRRVGGSDQGWHLKQPSGPDTRTETRLPLGRAVRTVPHPLREVLEPLIGSQRLSPVARVMTHRRERALLSGGGEVIARFCDDEVHAERLLAPGLRQHWREWEVEIAGAGRPELLAQLDAAVVAVGALPARLPSKVARALAAQTSAGGEDVWRRRRLRQDSETGEVLRAYVAARLSVLAEHDAGLRGETVHDLRIAARRLRSVLASYQPVFEPGAVDAVRDELRWLGSSLAAARDFEVLRRHLDAVVDDEHGAGPMGAPLKERIDHDLQEAHLAGRHKGMQAVASERYAQLCRSVQAVVESPALSPDGLQQARKVLPGILARDTRRVHRAAKAADRAAPGPDRDGALHEVRKKVKRLRYSAESAAPVLGKRARTLTKRAKAIQDALGAHQDTVASRAWLVDLAARAHGEDAITFGAGRLHAYEEQRAISAERDYEKALRRLPRKHVGRWVRGRKR
jgi:CHAD domain-containing protein